MPRQIVQPLRSPQDYLDRLFKIVPTEITAAYLVVQSQLTDIDNPTENVGILLGFAAFATLLVPFYLFRFQGVRNPVQLAVSTISFPIWASNISITVMLLAFPVISQQIVTIVMIAWVLTTPLLIPTDSPAVPAVEAEP